MRTTTFLLVGVLLLAGACESVPQYPGTPSADVPRFRPAASGVATCGQPDGAGLDDAARAGYRTVVNFRESSEPGFVADEESFAASIGLRYVHVPVTPKTLSWSHADQLAAILSTPDSAPVLLHCATGGRAAAVYALWRVRYGGASASEAMASAEDAGLKPELRSALAALLAER